MNFCVWQALKRGKYCASYSCPCQSHYLFLPNNVLIFFTLLESAYMQNVTPQICTIRKEDCIVNIFIADVIRIRKQGQSWLWGHDKKVGNAELSSTIANYWDHKNHAGSQSFRQFNSIVSRSSQAACAVLFYFIDWLHC